MEYPKITIVTVSFNSRNYIEECLKSIIEQDYPLLEYIIVDGGSTDGTLDIIRKYEAKITTVIVAPNTSPSDALNRGLAISTGEIMGWLNSDDRFHHKSLFAIAGIFNDLKQVNWMMGFPTWYSSSGMCINEIPYARKSFYQSPAYISDNLHLKFARWSKWRFVAGDFNSIQQESTFWRRSLWEKAGAFIDNTTIAYDLELWTRFFYHEQLYTSTAMLAGFRLHRNQLSVINKEQYEKEAQSLIQIFSKKLLKQNSGLRIRCEWLVKLLKIFYYYEIPILKMVYPNLLTLPPYIYYDIGQMKFVLSV